MRMIKQILIHAWFGLGVGGIDGEYLEAPSQYTADTRIDNSTVTIAYPNQTPEFPDITYPKAGVQGSTTYKYAAPGSEHVGEKGYYTLELMHNIVSMVRTQAITITIQKLPQEPIRFIEIIS